MLKEKVTRKKEERLGVVNGEENDIKYREVESSFREWVRYGFILLTH